jgi:hypothetical protein
MIPRTEQAKALPGSFFSLGPRLRSWQRYEEIIIALFSSVMSVELAFGTFGVCCVLPFAMKSRPKFDRSKVFARSK